MKKKSNQSVQQTKRDSLKTVLDKISTLSRDEILIIEGVLTGMEINRKMQEKSKVS